MDRREKIARLAQTKEDEVLLARVYERITMAAQRNVPASSCFLSKREQMLVQELLRGEEFVFFGGAALSEREVCCYLPEYLDESWLYSEGGPIAAVRASFYEQDQLTHRDFLGSLMGSGIKRETVGDIYVAGGSCDFLVLREILPYVLQNLTSAGRTKLSLQEISLADIQLPQQAVKTVRDTVPSLRLDGIISSGFSISRGKEGGAQLSSLYEGRQAGLRGRPRVRPGTGKAAAGKGRRQYEKRTHQHRNFKVSIRSE